MTLTTIEAVSATGGLEMASACFALGDYDEAISLARAEIPSSKTVVDRFRALHLIACSEERKGWLKQSRRTLLEISEFVDDLPLRAKARFYGQRALVHSKLRESDAALLDLEAARFWAEESGHQDSIARARNNLAKQYSDTGRFDEAIAEVDAAIGFAESSSDEILLGQFYDMKAQILIKRLRFADALIFTSKAMRLLDSHPSLSEARETHGRALVGLGADYLEQDNPVDSFRLREKAATDFLSIPINKELAELALNQSKGNIIQAAKQLGIPHCSLLKVIKRFKIAHTPRRRAKSLKLQK